MLCPGEAFLELIYSDKVMRMEVLDWRRYDLDPYAPEQGLEMDAHANLSGS